MVRWGGVAVWIGLGGCAHEPVPECTEFEEVFVWADADGDGFGVDEPIGYVCAPGPGQAPNSADCDDDNAAVFPGAEEVCDLVDNDCNDRIDEAQPKVPWYLDDDGDGFGDVDEEQLACAAPGQKWILLAGDCDDADPAVNPAAREVCNGRIDDDCDGAPDDADLGVDPTTFTRWFRDADGDGFGNPLAYVEQCEPDAGTILDDTDCDDTRAAIHPGAQEVCNHSDDDCDALVDDEDDTIDAATQVEMWADADGDGYGDAASLVLVCFPSAGLGVNNDLDCDDNDPSANLDQGWYRDQDRDGYGGGAEVVFQCLNPGGGLAAGDLGLDCDDVDATVHPGAVDPCADGADQDCSGSDQCLSCKTWRDSLVGAESGVYTVEPFTGVLADVYCDMDTDGGGWTLVASTAFTTLDDAGTNAAYADLQTLTPASGHAQIWGGMRDVVQGRSDLRFACKNAVGAASFDVDLSFYDNPWYMEITTGTDQQSCFNENNGMGADPPPGRKNNINGAMLGAGNQWNAGYLEGEDACGDSGDFTVDFDDRGMDNNQMDGTDWGEDDGSPKCGFSANGQAWFIFVREL